MTEEEKRRSARLRTLWLRMRGIVEEIKTLSGDDIPDFNSVWGGAGPDC